MPQSYTYKTLKQTWYVTKTKEKFGSFSISAAVRGPTNVYAQTYGTGLDRSRGQAYWGIS